MWLAYDIGTTGTKAALIDSSGRTFGSAYRAYDTRSAEGGIVEQQPEDWRRAVVETTRELDVSRVDAIALTGQMQDVILIDGHGNPVHPAILYSDARAHREAEQVNQAIGADRLRQLTGNSQEAGSLLAKLRWLTQYEPKTLEHSQHLLLGAADYTAFQMTGVAVTDTTTASTTGLLDINTRTMLGVDVFAQLSLSHVVRLLPAVGPGGSCVGGLKPDTAKTLGLKPDIPVYHGPGDAGATTLGVGSGEPGAIYAYIGTSGWVAFTSAKHVAQDSGVFTLAHPAPDKFIYVAPLLTAGGNLDWIRDLFGAESYGHLIEQALAQPPTRLLYLPYLNGERSPFSDPFARGAFIGLNARHSRADLCRAVLEGVVFAYRHALDALIGEPVVGLTLTGGGTRSTGWRQLFADITGIPATVADDAANVGVRGAVLAAEVGSRKYPDFRPPGFFPAAAQLQPGTNYRSHYDHQYGLFRQAYPALKQVFSQMQ